MGRLETLAARSDPPGACCKQSRRIKNRKFMPIYKQINGENEVIGSEDVVYHDDKKRLAKEAMCVHFGYGDIAITSGVSRNKDYADELIFQHAQEPHEVGEYQDEKNFDPAPVFPPVRFVFDKVESIDVVIERLQTLRAEFPVAA
jgi:hypothetical protein